MSDVTARRREWAKVIAIDLRRSEYYKVHPTYIEGVTAIISAKLAEIEGDPPERLEDAVTDVLMEYGVATKSLTHRIVATVQPFCRVIEKQDVPGDFKIAIKMLCDNLTQLQADNDALKKQVEELTERLKPQTAGISQAGGTCGGCGCPIEDGICSCDF